MSAEKYRRRVQLRQDLVLSVLATISTILITSLIGISLPVTIIICIIVTGMIMALIHLGGDDE